MLFELLIRRLPLYGLIAMCLRQRYLHLLPVKLEPVHLLHRLQCRLLAIEYDKGLAFTLQAGFSNDVEDRSIVVEDGVQRLLERLDLDTLGEIVYLRLLANAARYGVQCNARC
jgi:hypothetical protein